MASETVPHMPEAVFDGAPSGRIENRLRHMRYRLRSHGITYTYPSLVNQPVFPRVYGKQAGSRDYTYPYHYNTRKCTVSFKYEYNTAILLRVLKTCFYITIP